MPPCAPAPLCRHLDTGATPCGSPALRGKPLCFYHDAARQPLTVRRSFGRVLPSLPAPNDLHAIQIGYAQLLSLIAEDEIAPRLATLLLRTLAGASANLARLHRRERTHPAAPVADFILDPTFGNLTPEPPAAPQPAEQLPKQNQYFSDPQQISPAEPAPIPASHPAPLAQPVSLPNPGKVTAAIESHQPSPTPILPPAPAIPGAEPTGPLTLAEQYVTTDHDHRLEPAAHRRALHALAARLASPTPEDRHRDLQILAKRKQNQYFANLEKPFSHPGEEAGSERTTETEPNAEEASEEIASLTLTAA